MNRTPRSRIGRSGQRSRGIGKEAGGEPFHAAVLLTIMFLLAASGPIHAITYDEIHKLTASDAAADDFFGGSVAVSGTAAVIGADGNSDAGLISGSAYVFDVTTGAELFKLTASDAAMADGFASSVAVSGATAVIGASGNDDGGSSSGSAYVFDVTTGNELFKLTASDAAAGDVFGRSVAVSGTTAVIGAIPLGQASRPPSDGVVNQGVGPVRRYAYLAGLLDRLRHSGCCSSGS